MSSAGFRDGLATRPVARRRPRAVRPDRFRRGGRCWPRPARRARAPTGRARVRSRGRAPRESGRARGRASGIGTPSASAARIRRLSFCARVSAKPGGWKRCTATPGAVDPVGRGGVDRAVSRSTRRRGRRCGCIRAARVLTRAGCRRVLASTGRYEAEEIYFARSPPLPAAGTARTTASKNASASRRVLSSPRCSAAAEREGGPRSVGRLFRARRAGAGSERDGAGRVHPMERSNHGVSRSRLDRSARQLDAPMAERYQSESCGSCRPRRPPIGRKRRIAGVRCRKALASARGPAGDSPPRSSGRFGSVAGPPGFRPF